MILGTVTKEALQNELEFQLSRVDEVIFGCVLQAAQGQNVARQSAIYAGIPKEVPAFTLNKRYVGSGLRSVSLAAQITKAGDGDIILAGGMENMSAAP